MLNTFVSLGIAIVVYQQWLANRHEISIDKYYDRLENVNKRLEALEDVKKETLHIFSELDKLEYVVIKYELGYLSSQIAFRAIENFLALCKTRDNFFILSYYWVNEATYLIQTRGVVNKICEKCISEQVIDI